MTAGSLALEEIVIHPARRREAVLRLVQTAQRRLVLSIFRCDDDAVLDALTAAASRQVQVRVLMTGRARHSAWELARVERHLRSRGVDVRRFPEAMKYHAKFAVADDRLAMVASCNVSRKCFSKTADFVLLTTDPDVVRGLARLFEADWTGRVGEGVAGEGGEERLIVGPNGAPRRRFIALLCRARRRIRLLDAKLSDPEVLAVLEARRRDGVAVEIRGTGDLGTFDAHGKLLIVDDGPAVVGSVALTRRALEARRELAIVVHDGSVLRHLDEFWAALPACWPPPLLAASAHETCEVWA